MGWEKQGCGNYSGGGTYRQEVDLSDELVQNHLRLEPTAVYHTMEVRLNGADCGVRAWAPYTINLGRAAQPGKNVVEIYVTNTAGNAMYAGTQYDVREKAQSGLIGPVKVVPYRIVNISIRKRG